MSMHETEAPSIASAAASPAPLTSPILSHDEIVSRVNELMQQGFELSSEKLLPTATLFGDLGLDSLDAVDMLVHLEDKLGIKVDSERLMGVRTLQDVYGLVTDLSGAPQAHREISH